MTNNIIKIRIKKVKNMFKKKIKISKFLWNFKN